MSRRDRRGFTMLELMFVTAIVSFLASIAVPEYLRMRYRASLSEADYNVQAIARHLMVRMGESDDGRLPNGANVAGASVYWLAAAPNPPLPVRNTRRPFDANLGDWVAVPTTPGGDTPFSYSVSALKWSTPGASGQMIEVYAFGDLDEDGVLAQRCELWNVVDGTWARSPLSDLCNTGIAVY
jgi:prepilin-type N-terminal cleavage/methylation domain-containing protein